MTVREFLDTIDRNRDIFERCLDKEVEVHLLVEGHVLTKTFDLYRPIYKFNPWHEKPKGTLVLEIMPKEKIND